MNFSGTKTTVIFHQDGIITETDKRFLATTAKQNHVFFSKINQPGFAGIFWQKCNYHCGMQKILPIWAVFSHFSCMPITTKNGLLAHPSQMTHKATPLFYFRFRQGPTTKYSTITTIYQSLIPTFSWWCLYLGAKP